MSDPDKIVQLLRMQGPSLPTKIGKALNTQILFASALLSDLASQGKVKISYLKIGGSPLYYLPGQEAQLYRFASGNINSKDFLVLERLREAQVLREADLDLLGKVAIRSLRDFAVPMQVTLGDKKELFWKWHLCSAQELDLRLQRLLGQEHLQEQGLSHPQKLEEIKEEVKELTQEKGKEERKEESMSSTMPMQSFSHTSPSILSETKDSRPKESRSTDFYGQHGEIASAAMLQRQRSDLTRDTPEEASEEVSEEEGRPRVRRKRRESPDEFFPVAERFFKRLSIIIEQKETIRKDKELEFVLKVPSAVGLMTYFCKAKDKTKCDEKDLSAAYMQAQMKKLPLLLLHTGELTKKAQEMLDSGAFENAVVKKVG